jgi:hypothetical protein
MLQRQEAFQHSKPRLSEDDSLGRTNSSSSCEDIESRLLQDEKEGILEERSPFHLRPKRYSTTIKTVLILSISTIASGIIFLAAKWTFTNPHSHPNTDSSIISLPTPPIPSEHNNIDNGGRWQDAPDLSLFYEPRRTQEKDYSGTTYLLKDPCGHTPAEARARGCRFGVLNYAWVPEACYDAEIEEQFRNYSDWEFWQFPDRTGWVSWDEAAKGEFDLLFIDWDCEFLFKYPPQECWCCWRHFSSTALHAHEHILMVHRSQTSLCRPKSKIFSSRD